MLRKVLKRIIKYYYKYNLRLKEKEMLKKHPEFNNLNSIERKMINKDNKNICKVFKNMLPNWDNLEKVYFVSDYIYQTKILSELNDFNYNEIGIKNKKNYFLDKNYQSLFMEKFPNEILRRINGDLRNKEWNYISEEDALKVLNNYDKVIFKCSIGSAHGKGVAIFEKKDYKNALKNFGDNFVVQTLIQQHQDLCKYNNSSVNVIRITSLLWKNDVYILGAILRVGAPGAICDHLGNEGCNPRIASVAEDGTIGNIVVDPEDAIKYDSFFGIKPDGKIPQFLEMKDWVKKQHIKYPHHRLIGWDLTVDKDGEIVCIEYNSLVPGIIQTQMVCGPIFAKKTNRGTRVLDEILSERNKEKLC